MSGKTVIVLATLDTKGREAQYLRACVGRRGHRALVVNGGVQTGIGNNPGGQPAGAASPG